MTVSNESLRCPRCGAPVSAEDFERSLCVRCLIGVGLDDSLAGPGSDEPRATVDRDPLPDEIGPYRVLELLGEGGMGVVYLAEQTEPIRRQVALKLIRPGMDTATVVARFESERHALALMNHPNIAKVHDAGVTRDGRPYFVMEYVPGASITRYCDEHELALSDRLDLFAQACDAIQHAHLKGLIHRDIKPSNVLVSVQDGKAAVKVIDFGVARATERDPSDATLFTRHDVLVGTPAFMSPEQAGGTGRDVDTRTDVYSLGVLLYELLTGALPFDPDELREAGFEEMCRRIREEVPPRPSARLVAKEDADEAARKRRSDVASLSRALRGDLDWIAMKALDKESARRYQFPNAIAADIARHLAGQPVLAGPPSASYRVGKFVRRHKVGVAAISVVLTLLVAFAVTMTVQAGRIARERDRANREAEAATLVSSFLVDLFEVSDPGEARGNTIAAREILDRGAEKIATDLASRPTVQARLMSTMGTVYKNLGLYGDAGPLLERARDIYRAELGDDSPDTIRSSHQIADLRFSQGSLDEAERILRDILERSREALGEEHPETLASMADLAVVLHFQGRLDEAETLYREALDLRRRVLGPDHPDTLETTNNIAALFYSRGRIEEAVPFLREALEGRRSRFGNDHPETLDSMINLAVVLQGQGAIDEAERLSREAVEIGRRVRPDHPKTLVSINNLGMLLQGQGRLEEAGEYYREALELMRGSLGDEHPDTLTAVGNLGDLYTRLGRYDEAEELLVSALETVRRTLPEDHVVTGYTLRKYGYLLARTGRLDGAERALLEAYEILVKATSADHAHTRRTVEALVGLYEARGEPQKAADWRKRLTRSTDSGG